MCTQRGKLEEIVTGKPKRPKTQDELLKKGLYNYSKSLNSNDRAQFILEPNPDDKQSN